MAAEGLLKNEAISSGLDETVLADYESVTQPFYTAFINMRDDLQNEVGAYNPLSDDYASQKNISQSTVDSFYNTTSISWLMNFIRWIPAPYLQVGAQYTIKVVGTSDFTLVGAASNTVGTIFVATGPTTGTGQVLSTITTTHLSDFVRDHVENLGTPTTGDQDNGRFVSQLQVANGYTKLVNPYIDAASSDIAINTFTDMDDLTTGNITGVNLDTANWGQELIDTGYLFDFSRLHVVGTPQGLAEALIRNGLINSVADELASQGIDVVDLETAINENPNLVMKQLAQKRCYNAFAAVTGQQLDDILYTLSVTTPNITVLTDLLDLTKIFPETFDTLRSLNNGDFENIFITETEIAPYVNALETEFSLSMPNNVAKSNEAFRCTLQNLKGIYNTEPQLLGQAAIEVERNTGLSIINNLPKAVPDGIEDIFYELFQGGTGPNGTFYLTDLVGSSAGIPHTANFNTMISLIGTLDTANAFDFFNVGTYSIYNTMRKVIAGDFDNPPLPVLPDDLSIIIPSPYPAAGTYTSRNAAIVALNAELVAEIANLYSTYLTQTTALDDAFYSSMNAVIRELFLFGQSSISFLNSGMAQFDSTGADGAFYDQQIILGFAENLDTYGKDETDYGIRYVLESTANTTTRSGQAILAAMIEGRNKVAIGSANISADNEF